LPVGPKVTPATSPWPPTGAIIFAVYAADRAARCRPRTDDKEEPCPKAWPPARPAGTGTRPRTNATGSRPEWCSTPRPRGPCRIGPSPSLMTGAENGRLAGPRGRIHSLAKSAHADLPSIPHQLRCEGSESRRLLIRLYPCSSRRVQIRETSLFERPSMPRARARSSTLRTETPFR
jgi:hypothetical protein